MAQARSARGKNEDPQLTVRTENTRLVRYLLYLYCVFGNDFINEKRNGFKFLKQFESKTSRFKIVFKSLARFGTQFRVKGSSNRVYGSQYGSILSLGFFIVFQMKRCRFYCKLRISYLFPLLLSRATCK